MQELGQAVLANIRQNDTAVHYSLTTIAIILTDTNDKSAFSAVDKLRKTASSIRIPGRAEPLNFTAGLAELYMQPKFDAVDVVTEGINRVEAALELARQDGGNKGSHATADDRRRHAYRLISINNVGWTLVWGGHSCPPPLTLTLSAACHSERSEEPLLHQYSLLPLKLRRSLLQKRARPFLLIFRRARHRKQRRLQEQSLGERHLHTFIHGLHAIADRQRRIRRDLRRNRLRARNKFGGSCHFIDQTDAKRFLCGDHFAGQVELHRDSFADQSRQSLRSAIARNHAELYFRLSELRIVRRNPHRARHRHFASSAERESIDACDYRLAEVLDEIKHSLSAMRVLLRLHRRQLACSSLISAPAMNAFSPAPVSKHHADAGIVLRIFKRRPALSDMVVRYSAH